MARLWRKRNASPILDARVVDLVALSPDESTFVLSMIETRPWDGGDKQLREVQKKLWAYLNYIESGELEETQPDARDKAMTVILQCVEEPTDDVREFLRLASKYVRERGVSLEVWPEDAETSYPADHEPLG